MRRKVTLLVFALLSCAVQGQGTPTIGIIDFYGLRTITESQVRALLPFKEGNSGSPEFFTPSLESKIAEALGIHSVKIAGVCCSEPGVGIVYVGVEEMPTLSVDYHAPPIGDAVLPREILETVDEIDTVLSAMLQSGDAVNMREDQSEGHALSIIPEIRALQERYLDYAEQYRERLLEVLHNSADAEQRAIAANVLGYASDKQAIVPELEHAVLDPSDGVRNDATRALAVIAAYGDRHPELDIEIRPDVYIDMLNSIIFSGWKKFEPLWNLMIQMKKLNLMTPLLEGILSKVTKQKHRKTEEKIALAPINVR